MKKIVKLREKRISCVQTEAEDLQIQESLQREIEECAQTNLCA